MRQPSTRSVFRPVLVGEVTSTTSRRDQYCLLWVTSTGPIADQYWSLLPPCGTQRRDSPLRRRLYFGAIPLTTTTNPPSREGSVSPLAEEGEMPHRTSSRGHLVGEPPHPNKRTTIGLCSDDYWYGGQTTIGFGCKPLLVCIRNQ